MKNKGKMLRREEIEFFLRLHGLWEGIISLAPPSFYDVESLEPLDVPPVWLWAGETEAPPPIWWECGSPVRPQPRQEEMELDLGDVRLLVLDGDPMPDNHLPLFSAN